MRCPRCSLETSGRESSCRQCGFAFDTTSEEARAAARNATPSSTSHAGDRRLVTVLFSDLTGFTALTENADPEDIQQIMGRVFGGTRAIVTKYGGIVDKYIGDAVMAVFGIPDVHEDDPVRAIRAASEIKTFVRRLDLTEFSRHNAPLDMHAGICTGMVVTGKIEIDKGVIGIVGDTVNTASRLCNQARSGEILVGEYTRALSDRFFEFDTLAPVQVKGKLEPLQVHRVVGARGKSDGSSRRKRQSSPLIGRAAELAEMERAMHRLRDDKLTVLFVAGDAGAGKSRLVEEFHASHTEDGEQWLGAGALAYTGNIPYFLLTDLLRSAWKIDEGEASDALEQKIRSNLVSLGLTEEETYPYIASLFSIEVSGGTERGPESWKKGLFAAIIKILTAIASQKPTVFVLEDLHWADPSSLALIEHVFFHFSVPAMCICTFRPPLARFKFIPRDNAHEQMRKIQLEPLQPAQAQVLVRELLDGAELPANLREFVDARAEGNPFFIEEIIRALIETGVLVRDGAAWMMGDIQRELDIPVTVQGVISARIDLLGSDNKRVLQEAAVIGRRFLVQVLSQVTDAHERLPAALGELEQSTLIHQVALAHDPEFEFRHVLTQEVAYGSLLRKERQRIHERVALVIEERLEDRLPDFYETLAFHFKQSNLLGQAVHYLMKAGDKCVSHYALEEAHSYYQEAFDLLKEGKESLQVGRVLVIALINSWAVVFQKRGLYREMNEILEAHKHLAESLEDRAVKGIFLSWLGGSYRPKERYRESYSTLRRALTLGEEAGDRRTIGHACTWLSWTCAELGLLDEGIAHGLRALEIAREFPAEDFLLHLASGAIGYNRYYQGNRQEVLQMADSLVSYGRDQPSDVSLAVGQILHGAACLLAGDLPGAIQRAQAAMEASAEPVYTVTAKTYLGVCYAGNRQFDEAEQPLREAIQFSEMYGYGYIRGTALMALGTVLMAKGEMARGMKLLLNAAEDCRRNERIIIYAQLQQTLGQIYHQLATREGGLSISNALRNIGFLARNVPFAAKRAEARYKEAIAVAEQHGAKGIAGTSYLYLGRLHLARKRREQARVCLARAEAYLSACDAHVYLQAAREALGQLASQSV